MLTDLTETKRIKDLGHLSGQGHVYDAENEGGFLVYLYKEGERAKYDGRKAEGKRDGYVVFIGSSAKLRTDIKSALEARV